MEGGLGLAHWLKGVRLAGIVCFSELLYHATGQTPINKNAAKFCKTPVGEAKPAEVASTFSVMQPQQASLH